MPMPPMTPLAPPAGGPEGSPAEEAGENPTQEAGEKEIEVKCAARDCKYNSGGYCSKTDGIDVSAGPTPTCLSYEKSGGGAGIPRPPMPMMGGMGGM